MILILVIVYFIGLLCFGITLHQQNDLIEKQDVLIDKLFNLTKENTEKIKQRNKLIEYYMKENVALKNQKVDLENNIEILANNLSPKKRKLVGIDNQD